MILDIEPIADVLAVAIYRQLFFREALDIMWGISFSGK